MDEKVNSMANKMDRQRQQQRRPRIEVLHDQVRIRDTFLSLVSNAKTEILLLMPSANAFQREIRIGVIDAIQEASRRGVRVRILTPISDTVEGRFESNSRTAAGRRLLPLLRTVPEADTPNTVTVLVVDKDTSLVIEQSDDSKLEFTQAIGAATYSTSNSTVLASIRFFERLWDEVGMLQRESQNRRTSELLQDILAHDIRNYNQASRTGAEMLRGYLDQNADLLRSVDEFIGRVERAEGDPRAFAQEAGRLRSTLAANARRLNDADRVLVMTINGIDGSSRLIDRAKKLGRIIAQQEVELQPMDLESAIRRSIALVAIGYPEKKIEPTISLESGAQVLADDLLDEVFTNVISNSVRYTEGGVVPVEIEVTSESPDGEEERAYWRIHLTDRGRGIPDELKNGVFSRYMKSAHGTGLGLSIVYALVTERYAGRVSVADRVSGDHTKGTRVELLLPRAR